MIKTIIFDLGGVVFKNGTTAFVTKLSKQYNLGEEFILSVITGELGDDYRTGKITRETFWHEVTKKLGITESADHLEELWINEYELIHETKDLITELKDSYALYYLSNNLKERVEKIDEKHNFLLWFEGGIFSHEVGVQKPHPTLYKEVLKQIKSLPEETIFIDDKMENLAPAEALGMNVLLFTTPKQLREDLIKFGIIISL